MTHEPIARDIKLGKVAVERNGKPKEAITALGHTIQSYFNPQWGFIDEVMAEADRYLSQGMGWKGCYQTLCAAPNGDKRSGLRLALTVRYIERCGPFEGGEVGVDDALAWAKAQYQKNAAPRRRHKTLRHTNGKEVLQTNEDGRRSPGTDRHHTRHYGRIRS